MHGLLQLHMYGYDGAPCSIRHHVTDSRRYGHSSLCIIYAYVCTYPHLHIPDSPR